MKKDPIKTMPLEQIQLNEGQLDWLPRNPRTWTQTDIDRTKRSLDEDPDFIWDRPILVVAGKEKGTFIAFAGNLRLHSARDLGWPVAPVVVYYPEDQIDRETVIRRAIKDNGSFGAWDYDALANEWDDNPLGDWGVPAWDTPASDPGEIDAIFEKAGDPKPKPTIIEIGVPVGMEDKMEDIRAALLSALKDWPGCKIL